MTDITRRTLLCALPVPFIPRALDALCRRDSIQLVFTGPSFDSPRVIAAIHEALAEGVNVHVIIDGKRLSQ